MKGYEEKVIIPQFGKLTWFAK